MIKLFWVFRQGLAADTTWAVRQLIKEDSKGLEIRSDYICDVVNDKCADIHHISSTPEKRFSHEVACTIPLQEAQRATDTDFRAILSLRGFLRCSRVNSWLFHLHFLFK